MKYFSRRRLLTGAGAGLLACLGLGSLAMRNGLTSLVDHVIRQEFGDRVADDPAAAEFGRDFASFVLEKDGMSAQAKSAIMRWSPSVLLDQTERDDEFRTWVLENFIFSTTAVRSFETGDELVYVAASFQDDQAVCANTLSSHWL